MLRLPLFASLAFLPAAAPAQPPLQQHIASLAKQSQGTVAVACALPGTNLNCDLNPTSHPPMQSTFKLPLAVAVLHAVEQGKFSLDQPVRFLPSDLYPGTYSPLHDLHPKANVDVPLRQLIELSAGRSDNTATDILLLLMGGPEPVQRYLDSLGLGGLRFATPKAACTMTNAANIGTTASRLPS